MQNLRRTPNGKEKEKETFKANVETNNTTRINNRYFALNATCKNLKI